MSEEQTITNEQFLQSFLEENQRNQNTAIAKQQDVIKILNAKIDDLKATQANQNETAAACKAVIESNAYPALNPMISSFSAGIQKSAERKDKKIKSLEKKIKKVQKKIQKLERKQKRTELLKSFIGSLRNKKSGQAEYIDGMKALREDSLMRAEKQLDKTNSRIAKAIEALESGKLNNVQAVKIDTKKRNLESKRDKIIDKIQNLNTLEQELNKLAKIDLAKDKIDELKNTAVETAEKKAINGDITEIIDIETKNAVDEIKTVTEPQKIEENKQVEKKQNSDKAMSEQVEKQAEKEITKSQSSQGKLKNITSDEIVKLAAAGIDFSVVHKNGVCNAVFDKSKLPEIEKALSNKPSQAMKR